MKSAVYVCKAISKFLICQRVNWYVYCEHWELGAHCRRNVGRKMKKLISNVNEECVGAPSAHFLNGDLWDAIDMHSSCSPCS